MEKLILKRIVENFKIEELPYNWQNFDFESFSKEDIRFEISENDFERIKNFNEFIEDDRILLMLYDTEPISIKIIIINFQKLKRKMLI
jgi:hypothetical protein